MKEKTSHKNSENHDESECTENSLSVQTASPRLCAAGLLTPAHKQVVESVGDKTTNIHDSRASMAVSVTRHASTPYFTQFQNQIVFGYSKIIITCDKLIIVIQQYGYSGRESSKLTNYLPNSLPRKDEQDQILLREVESGRESPHIQGDILIDKMIRKAIDQSKNEVYNLYHGKSDLIEGLIKEINNGSI